jgi:hypothetical protein
MRIYIINSMELVQVAQKNHRVLDFVPLEAKVAINVMDPTPAGKKVIVKDTDRTKDLSYIILFSKAIHPTILPGAGLDAMNKRSVQNVVHILDKLESQAPRTLQLFE